MAKKKVSNPFPDYIRVSEPDKKKLAELIKRAMGNRTNAQFAMECGVNPSTLTRVLRADGKKPNSDDFIKAVALNAEPNSGVSEEMLLEAHGLAKDPTAKGKAFVEDFLAKHGNLPVAELSRRSSAAEQEILLEKEAFEIIRDALIERGYSAEEGRARAAHMRQLGDFSFVTDALDRYGLEEWVFEVKSNPAGMGSRLLNQMFSWAYMNEPRRNGKKISFVVTYRALFLQLVDRCHGLHISDVISIIPIDLAGRKVTDEYDIPCKYVENQKSVFLDGE